MTSTLKMVGRFNEHKELQSAIESFFAKHHKNEPSLEILGISGYGGVGKTYLLEIVEGELAAQMKCALRISSDASNNDLLKDFINLIDFHFAPFEVPDPGKPKYDYFPETRRLVREQKKLIGMVDNELEENSNLGDEVKKVAKALYRLQPAIKIIPKAGTPIANKLEVMENFGAEKYVEPAIEILLNLKSLSEKRGFFQNPLTKRRLASLSHNPFEALGEAYYSDLTAILSGYEKKYFYKLTHSSIKGLDRLFIVIDDFERLVNVIGQFLINNVLVKLKKAPFPSLVIIVGRDDLYDAHPDFAQHLGGNIKNQIRLEPFMEEQGRQYLVNAGYTDSEATDLYKKSRGFPFILRLLAENRSEEAKKSAVFFRRFYERTTRWMTIEERNWLNAICYLDVVNLSTIKFMLSNSDAETVMKWFEKEASVRDTKSELYTVNPYIRHMLLEHRRRIIGDAEHQRNMDNAKKAMGLKNEEEY